MYLNKHKDDEPVLRLLIEKLKCYSKHEINFYIIELIFFCMYRPFIPLGKASFWLCSSGTDSDRRTAFIISFLGCRRRKSAVLFAFNFCAHAL